MHYNKPKDHVPGGNLMSASANARFDDSLWKNLLTEFFVPMLHAVLPEMVPFLDSSRPVRFLDKELRRMAKYALHYEGAPPEGKRFVDLLADVPLVSGESTWILFHAEVQGRGSHEDFPLRMHRYRCRLEARYNRPLVAVALLAEPLPANQASGEYLWEMFGTKVVYRYRVFKTFEGNEKALAESPNPFDLAHLAALKAWKSRKSDRLKLGYMKEILDLLDERGWTHHQKAQLLTFMEGVMHLNEEDAVQEYEEWEEALERKKEAGRMYISLMERKGMEMGREETKITAAHRMLSRGMAVSLIAELLDLSEDRVRELANRNDMPGCSTSKEHPD